MKTIQEWHEELCYTDTFSVYPSHWEDAENSVVFVQDSVPTIVDAPCYLSRGKATLSGNSRMDQPQKKKEAHNEQSRILVLFCDCSHQIAIGDLLVVKHLGESFMVVAGAPHKYPQHQEILVYLQGDA